ncbi:hypothetical protein H257_11266 [Aphanomyces astaci]|uniref:Uncharacterized protein n=1 Tax=Aphanomyces astaci TaxID=112090 RepID=W4G4G9_APHAT|nr:hypothetical protein H257_11266 [Aphanomyces astaci]ETV73949.1 hypothetical protein H257_11266 [Aphanomyces astaci]|eukprot:XP_009836462.1 hypothetical protein H257_11266 [Aphanomyces astaci]
MKRLVASIAQRYHSVLMANVGYLNARPTRYLQVKSWPIFVGNLLCPIIGRGTLVYQGFAEMMGRQVRYGEGYQSNFSPFKDTILLAAMASALASGDNPTLCYLITRRLLPQTRTDKKRSSLLLSSAAKYLFEQSHWIHHEIYYMDPASALFSGLVMLRWSESLYVMDINLWRLLTFERGCRRHATSTYLQLAIPHVE